VKKENAILFSGGAEGAEAEFGANAERFGIEEVNFTFEGHARGRQRGVRILNHVELKNGDVSLEYVSKLMNRRYTESPTLRKVLQSIWYQINNGQGIYVVGAMPGSGGVSQTGLNGREETNRSSASRISRGRGRDFFRRTAKRPLRSCSSEHSRNGLIKKDSPLLGSLSR
jgi:hypothetical protein